MTIRIAAVALFLLASTPLAADSDETEITKKVIAEVARNQRLGKAVLASKAMGELKPAVIDWALRVRSRVIADELVTSYRERNAEPAELDTNLASPLAIIDLASYTTDGAVDWKRIEADYPGTRTLVELSRPGIDSVGTFALMHARIHFNPTHDDLSESLLFHLGRKPDSTWKVEIMRHQTLASFNASGGD